MRSASIHRKTSETNISVEINLDGTGVYQVSTGIGFLDHMLEQLSRHSLIDLSLKAVGDLHIDQHHTTEDSAIALGEAFARALGDRRGIARFGHAYAPMDETLTRAAIDISGRPFSVWRVNFTQSKLGDFDTELFEHWFHSFAQGAGNLRSVENALRAAGAGDVAVTADPAVVRAAERIVLPGVGAFGACIAALTAVPGMVEALHEAVRRRGTPFLGVCVGMQLMADAGEEHGRHLGLGWIGGTVRLLEPADPACKVPHMGWNDVVPATPHPLILPGEAYYLHSYAFDVTDPADLAATTRHGGAVTAGIARDNMIGVQFHPEKSQAYGLAFLARFLEWRP